MISPMNAANTQAPGPDASRPGVRYVTIDAAHAGQRLDNFLLGLLKGVPRTRIYRLVRKGEVRLNKGRCHPDDRLQAGDIVRIPPVRIGARPGLELGAAIEAGRFDWLHERVLYEDEQLLAGGWSCGDSAAIPEGNTFRSCGTTYGLCSATSRPAICDDLGL